MCEKSQKLVCKGKTFLKGGSTRASRFSVDLPPFGEARKITAPQSQNAQLLGTDQNLARLTVVFHSEHLLREKFFTIVYHIRAISSMPKKISNILGVPFILQMDYNDIRYYYAKEALPWNSF